MSYETCKHYPHNSRYPIAGAPTMMTHCCSCGKPIITGDEYKVLDGETWCRDCVEDLPLRVLIPKLGGEWKTVQQGEYIECNGCKCCGDFPLLGPGVEYGLIDGNIFCEECLQDICCYERKTASREDISDGYDSQET